jgi:predicted metal-dependent phosphoesterase TrpH
MLKLDLHIHSQYSEDASGTPLEIAKVLKKKGLNGMAITDHNTIEGGLSALKAASKDFVVIPGIEISTKDGHIIALNVRETIPRGLTCEETVEKILDAGGIPIVPHLYRSMSGIKEKKLKNIVKKIPAIEVFNACSVSQTNLKTMKIAKKYNLGGTGGSDSHIPSFAGEACTTIDTNDLDLDSIISLIEKKKTWGSGNTLDLNYRRDRMIKSVKQFFERGFKRI